MAHIDWQETLSVGNDIIDRQHRKWIELYNNFDRIMTDNSPHEARPLKLDALQLLHEYMLYHFRYEEMLMANHGYPELPQHWRQHKDFDYKLFAYIRLLETDRLVSTSEILDLIHKWLVLHIQQEDQQMQLYIEKSCREDENPL